MRRYLFLLLIATMLISVSCSDTREPLPFAASGSIPAGLSSFPDENYLMAGSLNPALFFKSPLGEYISSRYAMLPLGAAAAGINLKKDINEISFALKFESRAFPQPYKTYQFILTMDFVPKPQILESLLKNLNPEVEEISGVTLYSFVPAGSVFGQDNPLYLFSYNNKSLYFSNSRQLIEKAVSVLQGSAPGLSSDLAISPLLEKMDKSSPFWLVIRQSLDSKNLLQQFIEPFEECYLKVDVESTARVLCVMDFEEEELARQAVKRHDITLKNMDKMEAVFEGMPEEEVTAIGIAMDFLRTVSAKQKKNLAIYSSTIEKEMFGSQLSRKEKGETKDEEK